MLRRSFLVWCALWLGAWLQADDLALVRVSEPWRIFKARAEASDPPAAWRLPGFEAQAWPEFVSGFGLTTWAYEASVVGDAVMDFPSVFLRREFAVERPADLAWLTLRIDYDGGFVAYLNGVELVRRGLPGAAGTPVPFNAGAAVHARGTAEEIDVSAGLAALQPGTNVLAIQWHFNVPVWSNAALVPELWGNFTRGPFLQQSGTDRQLIVWKTLEPTDSEVEFGLTPALGQRWHDTNLTTVHTALLTNLAPDTTYYYRAGSGVGGRRGRAPLMEFRSFAERGPVRFVALGDSGYGTGVQYAVARVVEQSRPDLILQTGDTLYPGFTAAVADFRLFSIYHPTMRRAPYYVAAGNHDVAYGGEADFFNAFFFPTNSLTAEEHAVWWTGPEHFYSFDHGPAHFVALWVPFMSGRFDFRADSPQARWLDRDLAATTKPWKICFLHQPLASSSLHRADDYNLNGVRDNLDLVEHLLPLLRRHGVQLILSGHDHAYERFLPMDGVYHVITAGGGAGLYGLYELDPLSAQFWNRHHCLRVRLDDARAELEAVDLNGEVFDRFTLGRTPPTEAWHPGAWHTPTVEARPADDGDGNVRGQRFDFVGTPIPTVAGHLASLGRVFVNHDGAQLYLGFDGVMIPREANVFVFLEVPGLAGVTNLVGLGNGVVDPAGQGADGLDFLENLSFEDFAPAVGCILGDEYGDASARSFTRRTSVPVWLGNGWTNGWRTNLALDIGQGVFRLDPSLSDVPGIRLQQFNRSPQTTTVPGEENADFITVAIPMAELALKPGDTLRLGAVVGGGQFSTNAAQPWRGLDDAFLGTRFSGGGLAPAVLRPVTVRLTEPPDADGDGLLLEEEMRLGTDPNNPDTDGDGLPDGWEVAHRLDPRSAEGADGAEGDPDGDGVTNLREWQAGTDPRDPNSQLTLRFVAFATGQFKLEWWSVPGRKYTVQWADSLEAGFRDWTGAGFPRVGAGGWESFEHPDLPNPGVTARFYRIKVEP